MSKLISLTVYQKDSSQFASASVQAYNSDTVLFVENATTNMKKQFPSASGSINSVVTSNYDENNQGVRHTLVVAETLAAIVTASA